MLGFSLTKNIETILVTERVDRVFLLKTELFIFILLIYSIGSKILTKQIINICKWIHYQLLSFQISWAPRKPKTPQYINLWAKELQALFLLSCDFFVSVLIYVHDLFGYFYCLQLVLNGFNPANCLGRMIACMNKEFFQVISVIWGC